MYPLLVGRVGLGEEGQVAGRAKILLKARARGRLADRMPILTAEAFLLDTMTQPCLEKILKAQECIEKQGTTQTKKKRKNLPHPAKPAPEFATVVPTSPSSSSLRLPK